MNEIIDSEIKPQQSLPGNFPNWIDFWECIHEVSEELDYIRLYEIQFTENGIPCETGRVLDYEREYIRGRAIFEAAEAELYELAEQIKRDG